jgi:hypothetical protein
LNRRETANGVTLPNGAEKKISFGVALWKGGRWREIERSEVVTKVIFDCLRIGFDGELIGILWN